MRTLVLIVVGLVVAVVSLRVASPVRRVAAAAVFTGVWLLVTAQNLRIGLSHGYSIREEAPLHLAIFALPVAAAWVAAVVGRPTTGTGERPGAST